MTVEALNCPNCGAGVSSDKTLCEFCKTRLKTIGCQKCLGLMFMGAKFCGSCGAIAAPIDVSLDGDALDCPRCRQTLDTLKINEARIHGCTRCDGLWIGAETFENMCVDRESQSAVLGFLAQRTLNGQRLTKVNYVPCPDCGQLMNRNNFARASGVIVDICKQHGVWFDADELPKIIEFIQKGGMEIARQREKMEIHDERSRLREERRKQVAQDRRFGTGNVTESDESHGIKSFIRTLFD